jgi:NhaA family Na+:H+ antiporter
MPIFALANAGVSFSGDVAAALSSPITLGVGLGLLLGKVTGILGFVLFFKWLGWVQLPPSMSLRHLTGGAFLAGIGFTMSLFITSLAFEQADQLYQAKMGILIASLFTGLIGYSLLRSGPVQESND